MKLRFNGNTLRLRLSRSDIQQVIEGNELLEKVTFGNGQPDFHYAFKLSDHLANIQATCQAHEIAVLVPRDMALEWAASDDIGLYHKPTSEQETTLSISVEKDFQCLHNRPGEDETDNFPNPGSGV